MTVDLSDLMNFIGLFLWQISAVASGAAVGALALIALIAAISKIID